MTTAQWTSYLPTLISYFTSCATSCLTSYGTSYLLFDLLWDLLPPAPRWPLVPNDTPLALARFPPHHFLPACSSTLSAPDLALLVKAPRTSKAQLGPPTCTPFQPRTDHGTTGPQPESPNIPSLTTSTRLQLTTTPNRG